MRKSFCRGTGWKRADAPWRATSVVQVTMRLPGAAACAASHATPGTPRLGKRKVALFVGYDGTSYRGLQQQPSQQHIQFEDGRQHTVEDVLEEAVYRSGGILESNRGMLGKINWSRSSRTDKRVHSLSTVISMKLECNAALFETEPDGGSIAMGINAHLPPEVRVFAVQRVVKSFDARRECIRRHYDYYLPLSFLELMMARGGRGRGEFGVDEVLARLEGAWKSYAGHHAFHNFTKRRLYRPSAQRRNERTEENEGENEEGSEEESEGEDAGDDGIEQVVDVASNRPSNKEVFNTPTPNAQDEESDTAGATSATSTPLRVKGTINFEWKEERDENDPIVRSHYRYIEECNCSAPMTLVDRDGVPCVKLTVSGASFMLHQIRHMVGAAVLVALDKMPQELLDASMAPPVRMNLPLAPPGTLVLRGADFGNFRKSYDGKPSATERCSGSTLRLLDAGVERRNAFERTVLFSGVNDQLQHHDWQRWSDSLSMVQYDTDEAAKIVAMASAWMERREEMRTVRAALRDVCVDELVKQL